MWVLLAEKEAGLDGWIDGFVVEGHFLFLQILCWWWDEVFHTVTHSVHTTSRVTDDLRWQRGTFLPVKLKHLGQPGGQRSVRSQTGSTRKRTYFCVHWKPLKVRSLFFMQDSNGASSLINVQLNLVNMLHPAETDPLLEWVEPTAEENAWLGVLSVAQLMYQCPPVTSGHLFTGSPARCNPEAASCCCAVLRVVGCACMTEKMYTLLFLVPWVYPRLEGASVPTPAGSWELWGEKKRKKSSLTDNSLGFFSTPFIAHVHLCVLRGVRVVLVQSCTRSLPPSRQSACLFMYGLNHASMKMPRWFSQNNTLSLDRKRDITNFPAAPCAKLAPYHFQTLRKETLPSSLDKNRNNLDVRLHPRIYMLGYVLHTKDHYYYYSSVLSVAKVSLLVQNVFENSCC